jgi:hypothetical protein
MAAVTVSVTVLLMTTAATAGTASAVIATIAATTTTAASATIAASVASASATARMLHARAKIIAYTSVELARSFAAFRCSTAAGKLLALERLQVAFGGFGDGENVGETVFVDGKRRVRRVCGNFFRFVFFRFVFF